MTGIDVLRLFLMGSFANIAGRLVGLLRPAAATPRA
jgi:hypothetical protein